MLCILYVNAVGALLAIAGISIERLLPTTAPRRWLWCLIIPASMFVPGFYRMHHNWIVTLVVMRFIHVAIVRFSVANR